jgi:hypothetical protein
MIRRNLDADVLDTLVANAYKRALLRLSYGGVDDARVAPFVVSDSSASRHRRAPSPIMVAWSARWPR